MIIRTLAIKLMILPFTLWSGPDCPKAGSYDLAEKPTVSVTKGFALISLILSFAFGATGYFQIDERLRDVLRARKRSSDRIAIALMRRMVTGYPLSAP